MRVGAPLAVNVIAVAAQIVLLDDKVKVGKGFIVIGTTVDPVQPRLVPEIV